jgi:hypothetical protein
MKIGVQWHQIKIISNLQDDKPFPMVGSSNILNHVFDLTLLRFFTSGGWSSMILFLLLRRVFLPWWRWN